MILVDRLLPGDVFPSRKRTLIPSAELITWAEARPVRCLEITILESATIFFNNKTGNCSFLLKSARGVLYSSI